MTIKAIALIAAVAATAFPSGAFAWQYSSGEDPMTDKPYAYMAEASRTSLGWTIGIKCWEGGQYMIVIGPPIPYDDAATYVDPMAVDLRADKGEINTIGFHPNNVDGRLFYRIDYNEDIRVRDFLETIAAAQSRIAIRIGNVSITFPASGSTSGMAKLYKTCSKPWE